MFLGDILAVISDRSALSFDIVYAIINLTSSLLKGVL